MRIGFYVSRIDREKGHERNVPAHIQVPLHTLGLLAKCGNEAHLITNPPAPERVLPDCLPRDVHIHTVVDSRRRSGAAGGRKYPSGHRDTRLLHSLKQFMQIRRIAHEQNLDVLHFHGYEWAAYMAALLRRTGLRCPVVISHYGPPDPQNAVAIWLCKRIDAATTATEWVAERWASLGPKPRIIRHGPARDLLRELDGEAPKEKVRVLFWRDASMRNGADICIEVFDRLAPAYPQISFDLAVRPNPKEVPGVDELAARHANVHVYRFPYPPGVSLGRLIAESICVLLPFRSLTTNPQLAVAETLAAGAAVVTTNVRSNPECIEHERTGLLIPPEDVDAAMQAVKRLLDDPAEAMRIGQAAAARTKQLWNWDQFVKELLELYREVRSK